MQNIYSRKFRLFLSGERSDIAFAVLANETYYRNPSNVPSATGAKNSVVLGNVTFPPICK